MGRLTVAGSAVPAGAGGCAEAEAGAALVVGLAGGAVGVGAGGAQAVITERMIRNARQCTGRSYPTMSSRRAPRERLKPYLPRSASGSRVQPGTSGGNWHENSYTSSIVEVEAGQTVVATGPYRVVRHPMYAGTLLMGLATPLLLGSYWAELLLVPGCALLIVRLLAEERLLAERLPGYLAYMNTARSRLIPGVW